MKEKEVVAKRTISVKKIETGVRITDYGIVKNGVSTELWNQETLTDETEVYKALVELKTAFMDKSNAKRKLIKEEEDKEKVTLETDNYIIIFSDQHLVDKFLQSDENVSDIKKKTLSNGSKASIN